MTAAEPFVIVDEIDGCFDVVFIDIFRVAGTEEAGSLVDGGLTFGAEMGIVFAGEEFRT